MHIAPDPNRWHFGAVKRQATSGSAPSAVGVASATVAADSTADTGSLLLAGTNTATESSTLNPTIPLAGSEAVITVTSAASSTPALASTSTTAAVASASASSTTSSDLSKLSDGAVVGVCFGAFAALALLILIVVWILKKWAPADEHANNERKSEPWTKLGEDDDRWEGMGHAPPQNQIASNGNSDGGAQLEKSAVGTVKSKTSEYADFSMFNKSPSVHSNAHSSEEKTSPSHEGAFDTSTMPNFAKYTPELAQQFAEDGVAKAEHDSIRGRQGGQPVLSWDGETVGNDSFLSMRMSQPPALSSSPGFGAVRQMSEVTVSSPLHRWHQAEVVTPVEIDIAEASRVHNPFADESEHVTIENDTQRSAANPFFGAQEAINPFADSPLSSRTSSSHPARRSSVKTNVRIDSVMSDSSTVMGQHTERTMLNLIAALDTPAASGHSSPENRLSIGPAPSMVSEMYTAEEGESIPPSPKAA